MVKKGNALSTQGRAVARLNRAIGIFVISEKLAGRLKKWGALGGLIVAALLMSHPSFASGSDLLAPQDGTVTGTFGHGSSLEKYFYYGEVFAALATYIKARSPMVFVGFAMIMIFTRLAFGLAG